MTRLALLTFSFFLLPSSFAKTFDWQIEAPTAGARLFTAYHGETVSFNLKFGGAMTNLSPVCIYYQTNGMDKAEWFGPIPGTVFHPTNDCGAATYRFFIRSTDPDGVDYTANGTLRLLDSPGFEPSEVQLPVRTLDFSKIEVLNPPWGGGGGGGGGVDAATVTNIAKAVAASATNGIPRITESQTAPGYAANAVHAISANEASHAQEATFATDAGSAYTLGGRSAPAIIEQLDAATDTNAQQTAAIAAVAQNSTNYTDQIIIELAGDLQDGNLVPNKSTQAEEANLSKGLIDYNDPIEPRTMSSADIFAQLDAATQTNAQQTAALDGKASIADATLAPVYAGGKFSEWVYQPEPDDYWPEEGDGFISAAYVNGAWKITFRIWSDTTTYPAEIVSGSGEDATALRVHAGAEDFYINVVRTENPVLGYTLGSQTNKVIAAPGTVSNIVTKAYVEDLGIKGGGSELEDPVRHCTWVQCVTNGVFYWIVKEVP